MALICTLGKKIELYRWYWNWVNEIENERVRLISNKKMSQNKYNDKHRRKMRQSKWDENQNNYFAFLDSKRREYRKS